MTNDEFSGIFSEVIGTCKATLVDRAKQYAADDDRLHNFKQAAALQRCTPQCALNGMRMKHEVALNDFIYNLESGDNGNPTQWEEKIIDNINYLILLFATCKEDKLI